MVSRSCQLAPPMRACGSGPRKVVLNNLKTMDLLLGGELATEESDLFVGPSLQVPSRQTTTWCWLDGARGVCGAFVEGGACFLFCGCLVHCDTLLSIAEPNQSDQSIQNHASSSIGRPPSSRICPCNCLRASVSVEMSSASGWQQTSCRVTAR